ncbi:hypothetical protein D3C73_185940 [compost metagenome]
MNTNLYLYNKTKDPHYLNRVIASQPELKLTDKLYYQGITFYLTSTDSEKRVYESLDELIHLSIITAPADYDGALIATIDESFREDEEDDLIRHFDSFTGIEEV